MLTFLNPPVAAAYHILMPIIGFLNPLFGSTTLLVTIITFTCLIRLCLHPLAMAAVRGEHSRQALAPQVAELKKKHKKNPQHLQQELNKLYQESGTTMFTGCLPLLIQIPFFTVLYRLFTAPTIDAHPNNLLRGSLLGIPANQHLFTTPIAPATLLLFTTLLALLAAVTTLSIHHQPTQPGAKLLRLLPYGTVLFATILPAAGALYLLTTTTWTTLERIALRRRTATATQPPS